MYIVLEKLRAGEGLKHVYSAGRRAKEPQSREGRRDPSSVAELRRVEKKEGEDAQSDYPSVTDSQVTGNGLALLCNSRSCSQTAREFAGAVRQEDIKTEKWKT